MKIHHILILLLFCSVLTQCKTEDVKPAAVEQKSATSAVTSLDTLASGAITMPIPPQGEDVTQRVVLGDQTILLGKWSVAKDSTYSWFPTTAGAPSIKKYEGGAGDYYNFRNDGKCYTRVAGVLDTLDYLVTADNHVILQKFGPNINGLYLPSAISPLTAHRVTIFTDGHPSAAGPYYRELDLKK